VEPLWDGRSRAISAKERARSILNEPGVERGIRKAVSTGFSAVQDVVYVSLGVLLSVAAVILLAQAGRAILEAATGGGGLRAIVTVLDRILLALMIAELLYTVQVSFREHVLVPEPFLLVALIAAVRRILVLTAEFSAQDQEQSEVVFMHVMWELALLTLLIVVLVGALVILQRKADTDKMARSHHV
jgi:uncharacterized membrane protein (DUF373 family)